MAVCINEVTLMGHLGKDPEVRMMQNGKEMASFSVATSDSWIDKSLGTRSERTEWHRIVVFNEGLVKIIKDFVRKGSRVYLKGSLRTRKWTDSNGSEKDVTEVVLYNFDSKLILLDSRSRHVGDEQKNEPTIEYEQKNEHTAASMSDEFIDDEIPF